MNGFNTSAVKKASSSILNQIQRSKEGARRSLRDSWRLLWENEEASPQEIFDELGKDGKKVLLAGNVQRQYIQLIVDAENTLTGGSKTSEDELGDTKYLAPALPVTIHEDGTVTVNE